MLLQEPNDAREKSMARELRAGYNNERRVSLFLTGVRDCVAVFVLACARKQAIFDPSIGLNCTIQFYSGLYGT